MNIKLLLRIYAGLMAIMLLGGVFAPEAMMEGFGMSYTKEVVPILHFALMGQALFAFVTFCLTNWLEADLQKVATTYTGIALVPVLVNTYLLINTNRPACFKAPFIINCMSVLPISSGVAYLIISLSP